MVEQLTVANSGESLDRVLQGDESSRGSGEDLSDLERLGQELLDLSSPGDDHLVFLGQLVHTENSDDVLERSVILREVRC